MSNNKSLLLKQGYQAIKLDRLSIDLTTVEVEINDTKALLVLDSGARNSVIHKGRLSHLNIATNKALSSRQSSGAGGGFKIQAMAIESFAIHNSSYSLESIDSLDLSAVVESIQLKSKVKVDGVIGQGFLIKYKAIIDMGKKHYF